MTWRGDSTQRQLSQILVTQQSILSHLAAIEKKESHIMATLDDLTTSTAALTKAVADLAEREGGESAATQAQVDAANQAVVDATAALGTMDQPTPPAPPT